MGVPEQLVTLGKHPLLTLGFGCPVKLWQSTVKQWCETIFHENVVWLAAAAAASQSAIVSSVVIIADDLLHVASNLSLTIHWADGVGGGGGVGGLGGVVPTLPEMAFA